MHFQSIYQTINPVTTKIFFGARQKKSFKKCLCPRRRRRPVCVALPPFLRLCCQKEKKKKKKKSHRFGVFEALWFLFIFKSLFVTLFGKKGKTKFKKRRKPERKKKHCHDMHLFFQLTAAFRHPAILTTQCEYAVRKKEKKRVTNVFKCHLAVENVFHGDFSLCVLTICSIYWATVAVFVLCLLCALSSVGRGGQWAGPTAEKGGQPPESDDPSLCLWPRPPLAPSIGSLSETSGGLWNFVFGGLCNKKQTKKTPVKPTSFSLLTFLSM